MPDPITFQSLAPETFPWPEDGSWPNFGQVCAVCGNPIIVSFFVICTHCGEAWLGDEYQAHIDMRRLQFHARRLPDVTHA